MKLLLSPTDAAEQLSISRSRMFELIQAGEVKTVKVGRLRRVPMTALTEYIERLTAAAN